MTSLELRQNLETLARKTNAGWLSSLNERKLKELEFHNRYRDNLVAEDLPKDTYEKIYGNKKFYRTVELSRNYVEHWIRQHCKGKIFLDYACGNGANAIRAAKEGASLAVGIDISDISVENARKIALREGVAAHTFFLQGDCENTGLPDACIDVAICSGVLHHLDLVCAFSELSRILKRDGIILAIEALDYNPLIKLYRNMTPQMRTEWEKSHILSYRDLRLARKFFEVRNIKHWHLFSIAGAYAPSFLPFLNLLDRIFLKLPLIKMMSWMFTFELHKKG